MMLYVIELHLTCLWINPSVNQGWVKVNGLKFPVLLHHVLDEVPFPIPASQYHWRNTSYHLFSTGNATVPESEAEQWAVQLPSAEVRLCDRTEGERHLSSQSAAPPAAPCQHGAEGFQTVLLLWSILQTSNSFPTSILEKFNILNWDVSPLILFW